LALAVAVGLILVAVGRASRVPNFNRRIGGVVAALLAAAGAFVAALRGFWVPSLLLIAVAFYFGAGHPGRRSPPDPMPVDEARAILGVSKTASRTEVEAAYRRLMLRAHPDQGGTTGLAARLNAARDRLLKKN
jgi:DnaJ-domain-containing protein 1